MMAGLLLLNLILALTWAALQGELNVANLVIGFLVSAALIHGGDNGTDEFIAKQAWLYVSILGAGYFISRGLAKSGSSEPYTDEPSDH